MKLHAPQSLSQVPPVSPFLNSVFGLQYPKPLGAVESLVNPQIPNSDSIQDSFASYKEAQLVLSVL